jgi:hypothetical protein
MRGFLVACDQAQEWLLSWWWENYVQEHSFPVAFADFGMSEEAKQWCRARGALIDVQIDNYRVAVEGEVARETVEVWNVPGRPFWSSRHAWFKKPFACLQSPFDRTIWMDLDCEILASLDSLFDCIDPISKIGIARRPDPAEKMYNSGVIVFDKDCPLIQLWAELSRKANHVFCGDDDALSHLIHQMGQDVFELNPTYNWSMCRGAPIFNAKVLHWDGAWGKAYIKEHGGLRKTLSF